MRAERYGNGRRGERRDCRGSGPGGRGRRRWGLRRRLNVTFAFVALAAVALTTWLTLGAVFSAQRELFTPGSPHESESRGWPGLPGPGTDDPWRDGDLPPGEARDAFRGVARTALLAGVLSFLLATIVAGFVTRRLTRPLLALEGGARRLAAGERGLRLGLPAAQDELRSLTAAFNGLVSGLERQEEWRRRMVADIAHDLRTPLAVLRSEIEAMQDGVRTLDGAGLTRLHHEVMLLSRLVEDLRTLSLAESGGLGLSLQTVPVEPFLRKILDSFAGRAAEAGVALQLGPIPGPLVARFDPEGIARVLGNLLDNALRYAAPGTVTVEARKSQGDLVMTVRDQGPGLPAGEEGRLFERFYRGDGARTRAAGAGSGLGLSIARALTEAHGGSLDARNHAGGGAVFTVALPVDTEEGRKGPETAVTSP